MKLHYYPETDSLYVELKAARPWRRARSPPGSTSTSMPRATPSVRYRPEAKLDLATLETEALPVRSYKAG